MNLFLLSVTGGNGQASLRGHSYSVCNYRSPAEETGQQEKHAGIYPCDSGRGKLTIYWLKFHIIMLEIIVSEVFNNLFTSVFHL